jgi:MFS superfamily sulfate permease-like transporter
MNKLKLTRNILTSALLIVIGVIIGMLISNHMHVKANTKPVAVQQEQSNNKPIRLVRVLTESTEDIKLDPHEVYKEYSNGAWTLENDYTHKYELGIPELEDWTYELNSRKDFDHITQTYFDNINLQF